MPTTRRNQFSNHINKCCLRSVGLSICPLPVAAAGLCLHRPGSKFANWSGHAAPPSELRTRECIRTDALRRDIPSRSEGSAGCPPIRRLRERWEGKSEPQLGGLPRARDGADSPCPSRRHSMHLAGLGTRPLGQARGRSVPGRKDRVGGTAVQLHSARHPCSEELDEWRETPTGPEPTHVTLVSTASQPTRARQTTGIPSYGGREPGQPAPRSLFGMSFRKQVFTEKKAALGRLT